MIEPEKDSKNYKWGFFYYNPADERLFVPKRNPNMGVTINFAKPVGYLIFLPAFILIFVVIILSLFTE